MTSLKGFILSQTEQQRKNSTLDFTASFQLFEGKLLYDGRFTCFHKMIEKQQQEPSKNLIQVMEKK